MAVYIYNPGIPAAVTILLSHTLLDLRLPLPCPLTEELLSSDFHYNGISKQKLL